MSIAQPAAGDPLNTTGEDHAALHRIIAADPAAPAQSLTVDSSGKISGNGAGLTGIIPAGVVLPHAGSSAPTGFLMCDGSAVSQSTYAGLYAVIGTTYGNPGGGNFNLPDLRTNVPAGYKSGDTNFGTLGGTGGLVTQTTAAHVISGSQFTSPGGSGHTYLTDDAQTGHTHTVSALQPYITLNYIIKT